jgi:hypothetical protein
MKPFDETKYYLGKLCKRGHDYDGTGKSLRYMSHNCVECIKISRALYQKENAEKLKEYRKNYRKENAEKLKEYRKNNADKAKEYRKNNADKAKEYRKINAEKLKEYIKNYRKENPDKIKKHSENNQARQKERNAKEISFLDNNYVKKLITAQLKIERLKILPETIELKREQLMLFREIKQYKKEISNGITTR